MMDMEEVRSLAAEHGLWVVEDAAHSFPAAYRPVLAAVENSIPQATTAIPNP